MRQKSHRPPWPEQPPDLTSSSSAYSIQLVYEVPPARLDRGLVGLFLHADLVDGHALELGDLFEGNFDGGWCIDVRGVAV